MPHAAPERHVTLVEAVSDRNGASARRHRSAIRSPEGARASRTAMPAAVEAAGIDPGSSTIGASPIGASA